MVKKKKINLSDEKLKLEIRKLNNPWYKQFDFWKILIPTFAVLFSLYFTFGRGVMDVKNEKLTLKKEQLKLEILQFEAKKGNVIEDIDIIQSELLIKEKNLDSINKSLDLLKKENNLYKNQIVKSKKEINIIKKNKENEINSLLNQQKLDEDFLIKEVNKQYQIAKKRAIETNKYKQKISTLEETLRNLNIENDYYSKKVKLTTSDRINIKILVTEASIKHSSKVRKEFKEEMKRIDENLINTRKKIKKNDISVGEALRILKFYPLIKDE